MCVMECDKRGLLATGASDNSVRLYQYTQGYLTHKFKHKQPVTALAFIDLQLLLISASMDNTVKIWDLNKYNCMKTLNVEETIRNLKANEKYLIGRHNDGVIRWNLSN